MPLQTQYLVLQFDDAQRPAIPIVVRYEAEDPMYNFTRTDLMLPPATSTS